MRFAWLLVAVVVTACAPARIDLDPHVRDRLPSAPVVHLVAYPADGPGLMTAKAIGTGALFGPFGGAVVGARAATIGKELRIRQGAEDLSVQLATRLGEELKATLPNLKRAAEAPAGDEVDALKKAGLLPLVLDVRSAGNIIYYGSNWARYRLVYAARVRLVDTQQERVLWQGVCTLKGAEDPAQAPTLDDLEATDGVAYRRLLGEATSGCATEILKQFRGDGT
jgi:hypothetical protein